MSKKRILNYTFDKTAKKITFTDYGSIRLDGILIIANVTDNILIYNFADPTRGGVVTSNYIVLTYDTSTMDNGDSLLILYDDGLTPEADSLAILDDWDESDRAKVNIIAGQVGVSAGAGAVTTNTPRVTLASDDPSILYNRYTAVQSHVSSPQNVTASWADFGAEIDCRGYKKLIVWITLTHTNSTDNRIKALGKHTSAGADEYELPLLTVGATVVTVQQDYYELDDDVTQKTVLEWDVTSIPYVQLQIQCSVVGATADTWVASITKMY